jgi:hypothetical protein
MLRSNARQCEDTLLIVTVLITYIMLTDVARQILVARFVSLICFVVLEVGELLCCMQISFTAR